MTVRHDELIANSKSRIVLHDDTPRVRFGAYRESERTYQRIKLEIVIRLRYVKQPAPDKAGKTTDEKKNRRKTKLQSGDNI